MTLHETFEGILLYLTSVGFEAEDYIFERIKSKDEYKFEAMADQLEKYPERTQQAVAYLLGNLLDTTGKLKQNKTRRLNSQWATVEITCVGVENRDFYVLKYKPTNTKTLFLCTCK